MNYIDVTYRVSLADFRRAAYFGLFLRHRRSFVIICIAVAITLLYVLLGFMNLTGPNYVVYGIGAIHLVWGMSLLVGVERSVRRYAKLPDHFLDVPFHMQVGERHMQIRIPSCRVDVKFSLSKLHIVFEISTLFMIYTSPAEVYLLPKKALSEEEMEALRAHFRERLKEKFRTRF